jgi:hypothetical protein
MTNFKMLMVAIVGSLFCYTVIDSFIVTINPAQYLLIEFLLSIVHSFYNYIKNKQITNI